MSKYLAGVRYGLMSEMENFVSDVEGLRDDQTVILRTKRGVDIGVVAGAVKPLDREVKGLGEILRLASESDLRIAEHIRDSKEPEERRFCLERIQERKLPMKLSGVEHLFSGDKVIFYFIADGRVDFRELVKDLARRFRTRIEMRQIGVRDEARMLSDYEHCGRELCCRTHLRNLEPVTMRMAKTQKSTLDPTKISGHCGRLMCCLRFEDEVYTEHKKALPHRGDIVATANFEALVVNTEILSQKVTVQTQDGERHVIHVSEITDRRKRAGGGGGGNRSERGGRGRDDRKRNPREDRTDRGGRERSEEDNTRSTEGSANGGKDEGESRSNGDSSGAPGSNDAGPSPGDRDGGRGRAGKRGGRGRRGNRGDRGDRSGQGERGDSSTETKTDARGDAETMGGSNGSGASDGTREAGGSDGAS